MSDNTILIIFLCSFVAFIILLVALVVFMYRVKRDYGKLPISWIAAILVLFDAAFVVAAFDPELAISKPVGIGVGVFVYVLAIVFTLIKSRKLGLNAKNTVIAVLILPFTIFAVLLSVLVVVLRIFSIFGGGTGHGSLSPQGHN